MELWKKLSCVALSCFFLSSCAPALLPQTPPPDHVIIMVFDQMRPDYIDRFDLKNFKRFRGSSRNYPEAYVGHLGSQTAVSHLVIPTGLLPKSLPWQDNALVDAKGVLGKPGAVYETGSLTIEQSWRFLQQIPKDRFLASRLREKLGGKVFAVGQKNYATQILGGPAVNGIVTLKKMSGKCTPDGINIPAYIAVNSRFTLECSEPFGTNFPTIYTLDGSRYVPGEDPNHLGGDIWTADAAIEIMNHEQDWTGLFLTFGAIDKLGHMLAEHDDHGLTSVPSEYRLADALRIADQQLGRILDALESRGLHQRTLIVVTADHGGQRNESYLGNNKYQSCCPFENSAAKVEPLYWIEHLNHLGKLKAGYQDTSVKLWLADRSTTNEQIIVRGMADISGMVEVYALRSSAGEYRYERVSSRIESQTPAFQEWARRHNSELLATMAAENAPDLVGLLADGFGFGRIGDHGGAQEKVQRIPMILHVPGEPPATRREPFRLVDIAPEVTRILGLKP